MFKKKPPVINIGSSLSNNSFNSNSQTIFPNPFAKTSVQPNTIERAGDALGELIWKSLPIAKTLALGALALASGNEQDESLEDDMPWMDINHPDYIEWRNFLDR